MAMQPLTMPRPIKAPGLFDAAAAGGGTFDQWDWHYGSSRRYCKMELGWENGSFGGRHRLEFDLNPFKKAK